jgi:hypothetical protein
VQGAVSKERTNAAPVSFTAGDASDTASMLEASPPRMTVSDIVRLRLQHQQIVRTTFRRPDELVAWLGAVQAQDYPAAKWAIGQRLPDATEALVDAALAEGTILRTHVLRPTWHLVARDDIRWMLSLTAPRVRAALAHYDRKLGLDASTLSRSHRALAKALRGGNALTRRELAVVLQKAGIATDNTQRLAHLMGHAELAAVVCSGAPRGRQQTYALLDERAPAAKTLPRDEALAELAARYFASHGPATLKDYAWWSGLTASEAKVSLDMISARLTCAEVDGRTYWWSASARVRTRLPARAQLLPNFDEYIVGYTDRGAVWDGTPAKNPRGNILFSHSVLIDGRVVGTWKPTQIKDAAIVSISPMARLNKAARVAVATAAEGYGRFFGKEVTTVFDRAESPAGRRAQL